MKRVVFLLFCIVAASASFAQSDAEVKRLADVRAYYAKSDFVYPYVDSAPLFPGGVDKWNSYINSTTLFTDAVEKAKAQGMTAGVYTVMLRFAINADGTVGDVRTLGKAYGYGLEEAAIKLVKDSGKWTPANVEGQATKGHLQLPIRFAINR